MIQISTKKFHQEMGVILEEKRNGIWCLYVNQGHIAIQYEDLDNQDQDADSYITRAERPIFGFSSTNAYYEYVLIQPHHIMTVYDVYLKSELNFDHKHVYLVRSSLKDLELEKFGNNCGRNDKSVKKVA
jgi:hypothetical protein